MKILSKYNLKKYFINTPKAVYLCIRFPFLYPRNRFTGLHYNGWSIMEYKTEFHRKHHFYLISGEAFENYIKTHEGNIYNLKRTRFPHLGEVHEFWDVWYGGIIYSIIDWFHKHPLQWIHCIPTYTELDRMPAGWRKAFGIRMCKDIKRELKKTHSLYKYRIVDIKEKWGELRWDDAGGNVNTNKIVAMYSYISQHICINCGELATKRSVIEAWENPFCDKCFPIHHKYSIAFGLKDLPWFNHTGNIHNLSPDNWEAANKLYEEYLSSRK